MSYVQFTTEELVLNAAANKLRQHAEQHLRPATMGWVDAYATDGTRSGKQGFFTTARARAVAPELADFVAYDSPRAQVAWTTGLLGSVAVSTEDAAQFPFAAPESWQERISRQIAEASPDAVPTLDALQAAWASRPTPRITVAALLEHLGLSTTHRTNITNALNGKRESLPPGIRFALGAYLLPRKSS